MPRKPYVASTILPYHASARTNNREEFPLPRQRVMEIYLEYLSYIVMKFNVEPVCFILMPNHYHLILYTPLGNLKEAIHYFQREVSKKINFESGRTGHLFGGPYSRFIIDTNDYLLSATKYVLLNAVRAGLTDSPLKDQYSSLSLKNTPYAHLFSKLDWVIKTFFAGNFSKFEKWLSENWSDEKTDAIRRAFRRGEFKPIRRRTKNGLEDLGPY